MNESLKKAYSFLRKKNFNPWKPEWKTQLAQTLKEARSGLPANFVAVVAIESDYYFELLFFLGIMGLFIGTLFTYLPFMNNYPDLTALPLIGFCLGCSMFHLRRYFLSRVASKAIRSRVQMKAKALFYDHHQSTDSPTLFLYFSEMEREALLLHSTSLNNKVSEQETQLIFNNLSKTYDPKNPLASLNTAILALGALFKGKLLDSNLDTILRNQGDAPVYFISSKDNPFPIPVLKGKKDIN